MLKQQTVQEGINPSPFTFGIPPARSCVVDNFTQSYLFLQDAGVYVPPLSARTIQLPSPQSTVNVLWQTPPNTTAPKAGKGQATIIWSDAAATTTMSTPVYPNPSPRQSVGTFKTATSITTDGPFSIPPGSVSFILEYPITSQGGASQNSLTLVGDQTNCKVQFGQLDAWHWVALFGSGSGDTTFHITHTDLDSGQTVNVIPMFAPSASQVVASQGPGFGPSNNSWMVFIAGQQLFGGGSSIATASLQIGITGTARATFSVNSTTTIVPAFGVTVQIVGYRMDAGPDSPSTPVIADWAIEGHTSGHIIDRGKYNLQSNAGVISQTFQDKIQPPQGLQVGGEGIDLNINTGGGNPVRFVGYIDYVT